MSVFFEGCLQSFYPRDPPDGLQSSMASAALLRSSMLLARSATGASIIYPSRLVEDRPSAIEREKASTTRLAHSTCSSVGENPSLRTRTCRGCMQYPPT